MAKFDLRLKARKLRGEGVSVNKIASMLGISKGTASVWVRDIILSIEQLEALKQSSIQGSERGRLRSALLQKEKWNKQLESFKILGIKSLTNMSDREFLIAGLALYWGEGGKTRRVEFCNSDPKMIKFLLLWLKVCFGVQNEDIKCCVGINQLHKKRDQIVKAYWSEVTKIPLSQFNKTSFKKVESKKIYDNAEVHYGTLAIRIAKPSRFYGKIIGLIEGLYEAGNSKTLAKVAQW